MSSFDNNFPHKSNPSMADRVFGLDSNINRNRGLVLQAVFDLFKGNFDDFYASLDKVFTRDQANMIYPLKNDVYTKAQVDGLRNASFLGQAGTATEPNEELGPQFYIASQTGTYTNFNSIVVDISEGLNMLSYDGSEWSRILIPIELGGYARSDNMMDLEAIMKGMSSAFGRGRNLFSKGYAISGFYNSEGVHNDSDNRICTTRIGVKPDTDYYARTFSLQESGYSRVVFFHANMEVIGTISVSLTEGLTFRTPISCYFAAFTIQNSTGVGLDPLGPSSLAHGFQLEEGTSPTSYEDHRFILSANNVMGIPPAVDEKLPRLNRFFEKESPAAKIDWLNKAIVQVEFYNVDDDSYRRFYAVGKNYNFGGGNYRTYLSFGADLSSNFIIPTKWDNTFVENQPTPTGIETYYLRRQSQPDHPDNYIGKVTINWDEVPDGVRHFEATGPDSSMFTGLAIKKINPETKKYIDEGLEKLPPLNKFFEAGNLAATTVWVNRAIIDVEFYDVEEDDYRELYYLGINYPNPNGLRHYVGIKAKAINTTIVPAKWDGVYIEGPAPSGIATYDLRFQNQPDSPENYIGRITVNWDEMPSGTRMAGNNTVGNNPRLNRGVYKKKISSSPDSGPGKENFLIYDSEPSDTYFNSLIEDDFSNPGGAYPLGLRYVQDWYDLWDGLMSSAPTGYITKRTLGTDIPTSGGQFLPMYAYELSPPQPILNGIQEPYMPKVVILLAIHGFEKTGALSLYSLMKRMIDNWEESPFLEFLRFNIPFVIVPSSNPHGWQDYSVSIGSRTNFNGVDLNRNFPIGWSLAGEGTELYSGPSAGSEIETQYLMSLIDEFENDGFIGLDVHNFGELTVPEGYLLSYSTTYHPLVYQVGKSFSLISSRKLQAKYPAINQTPGFQLSRAQRSTSRGLSRDYLQHKIPYAATFETTRNFEYDSSVERWDNTALRIGSENIGNFLRMLIRECALDYNRS